MKIGDKLTGRITGIQSYGAFVELESGMTGLIHISEIRTGFIENIYDVLKSVKKSKSRLSIWTSIQVKQVFLFGLWKKRNINYRDGDVFQVTVSNTDLLLWLA